MNVYGVVFKDNGKMYFFDGKNLDIKEKDYVIVQTNRGEQYGKVVQKLSNEKVSKIEEELKEIIRIATEEDYEVYLHNAKEAQEALKKAKELSKQMKLEMKFLEAEYTFNKSQLLFNFYAEERVDFRELARKLAGLYKTRIELRQIGARDKASCIKGIGVCGRTLCCASFLTQIDSVSMNMAKNQNLSLNPSKINGVCGRLMCCLAYEDEEYLKCLQYLPHVGQTVKIDNQEGQVISVDILNKKYKVLVLDEIKEVEIEDGKEA